MKPKLKTESIIFRLKLFIFALEVGLPFLLYLALEQKNMIASTILSGLLVIGNLIILFIKP